VHRSCLSQIATRDYATRVLEENSLSIVKETGDFRRCREISTLLAPREQRRIIQLQVNDRHYSRDGFKRVVIIRWLRLMRVRLINGILSFRRNILRRSRFSLRKLLRCYSMNSRQIANLARWILRRACPARFDGWKLYF